MQAGSKILWSEGLTLGPQHFQLRDRYHEQRLHAVASSMDAHYWGVRAVEWEHEGLAHGRLGAAALSVIFPDGSSYDAPGTDLLPEALDLSRLPPDTQSFTFYLSLAVLKPHGGNLAADGRYQRSDGEVADLYSDAVPVEVPVLKQRARLVADFAPRDPISSVAVVRLQRAAEGGFEIDPAFIAPSVAIGATAGLMRMLDSLISALPGVPLTHMPQVPAAVPVRPNTYYFALSARSTLYEHALKQGALAVYPLDGIPGLKIELIAIS
jgi:type VI secretion system protein ImpJ